MATRQSKRPKIKISPVLFAKTQKIVKTIEKKIQTTFVTYWTSPSGSVCQNDVIGFYEVLQKIGTRDELVLFVKSDGGSGRAALRIVNLLRRHGKRVKVYLPLNCASAATMLALGADEILMGPMAYLTPIDTSITHELSPTDQDNELVSVSQDELNRVIDLWRQEVNAGNGTPDLETEPNPYAALFQYVHPLVLGAVDRASSLSVKLCTEILQFHIKDQKKAERISYHLNSDYPSHNYPIMLREAKRIGLKVKALDISINDELLELNELYSEMGQRAQTDFDELNYHNNEIINIIESANMQIYYQSDKDWHYRAEERRWVPLHDVSSWRKIERVGTRIVRSQFHIR